MTLKVWTDGTDKVVAEDIADVHNVMERHTGSRESAEHEWSAVPDDKAITIRTVDGPHGDTSDTKTAAEWVAAEGRGFLCSTEY